MYSLLRTLTHTKPLTNIGKKSPEQKYLLAFKIVWIHLSRVFTSTVFYPTQQQADNVEMDGKK